MTVQELNQDQLNSLKQAYTCETTKNPSYGELANAAEIPNEVIFKHYAGITFTEDDF